MTTSTLPHWLVLLTLVSIYFVDASISTAFSFPQDVFSKPAFKVRLGQSTSQHTNLAPVKKSVALSVLEQQDNPHQAHQPSSQLDSSSLILAGRVHPDSSVNQNQKPLLWTLQRSSATSAFLCSIPDFSSTVNQVSDSRNSTAFASRTDLIQVAQRLLEPLKSRCLYHTVDWFTYSFCHGRDIRQFRLLTPQSAAADAHKKAGGGNKGDKAALDAAKKVTERKEPVADPIYPAFTLGRWKLENDDIVGDTQSHVRHSPQSPPSGGQETSMASVETLSASGIGSGVADSIGTDLVEEVQFGDWDEEELVAAEAQVLSSLDDSSHSSTSAANTSGSHGGGSKRHRYVTQTWSDGTLCDVNNQPRTTEVQFHCSHRKQGDDRITLIKETTICNYVLIIETPKLCSEPAFGGEADDLTHQLECHRIVDDSFPGLTVGDGGLHRSSGAKKADDQAQTHFPASKGSSQGKKLTAGEPSSSSHTYGDLSQYNSVYDDYYDEALGNHGPDYERVKKEHMEDLYGSDAEKSGESFTEAMFYVGIDENGNVVVQSAEDNDGAANAALKNADTRTGKKQTADAQMSTEQEDEAVEIQLDLDDLLGVITGGGDGGTLEKKLAQKITQKLDRIQAHDEKTREQRQRTGSSGSDAIATEGDDDVFSQELGKLYKQLMKAVDATATTDSDNSKKSSNDSPGKPSRKMGDASGGGSTDKKGDADASIAALGTSAKQRMVEKKVGDSLAERAQRFYEAREREHIHDSSRSAPDAQDGKQKKDKESHNYPHVDL